MKKYIFLLFLFLFSCKKKSKTDVEFEKINVIPALTSVCPNGGYLINGFPVCNGLSNSNGIKIGISFHPSISCPDKGVIVEFFRDLNSDGVKNYEDYTVSLSNVCNDQSGQDNILSISPATTLQCPSGGILVNGYEVCNGVEGLNGQDLSLVFGTPTLIQCPNGGITVNGHPVCNNLSDSNRVLTIVSASSTECQFGGIVVNGNFLCNDADENYYKGPGVMFVKLCPLDTHVMSEYGFILGGELYSVFYKNKNFHSNQTGLVKLNPGTYQTITTGVPKTFTYSKTSSNITLTCGHITATYTIEDNNNKNNHDNNKQLFTVDDFLFFALFFL